MKNESEQEIRGSPRNDDCKSREMADVTEGDENREEYSSHEESVSSMEQRRRIKRRYADRYRRQHSSEGAAGYGFTGGGDWSDDDSIVNRLKETFFGGSGRKKSHAGLLAGAAFAALLLLMLTGVFGVAGTAIIEVGNIFVDSTYLSSDDDILATDEAYAELEAALQEQIDNIESTYPGYDEYCYQVDEITHDPYALISFLTAKYGNFTFEDIEEELLALFQEQYSVRVWDETEIRTRTVTVTQEVIDEETGETNEESYEVEEEYEWHILYIVVTNQGMDAIAEQELNEEQSMLYSVYQATLGNRSYLFGETVVGNPASGGVDYEVSEEALSDEAFANMLAEAEKYLGMAYVWGGSSPETGFDCSGYISWVINNCGNGWNVGRQTANGLLSLCTIVDADEAQPGDLIFFENTYSTTGASHVGLYVGNGMMIHCGSPIQYTSIETSYWQEHLLAFGRLSL